MEIKNISSKGKLIFLVSLLAISLVAFSTLQLVDAIHPPGRDIVTKTINPGTNTISFRDISNTNPTISSLELNTRSVKAGFITIIVTDADANLDLMETDAVLVFANSTSSGPNKATVVLEETEDPGTFSGVLFLSSSTTVGNTLQLGIGDDICVIYDTDPPGEAPACTGELGIAENEGVGRFSAELRGVNAGTLDLFDFPIVDPDGLGTRVLQACPYDLVTHPVDIQAVGDSIPDPNTGTIFSTVFDASSEITVTISYANAVLKKAEGGEYLPSELELLWRPSLGGAIGAFASFEDQSAPFNVITVNEAEKTITGTLKNFVFQGTLSGQYALGVNIDNCFGGGGGGLVRPGLVVNVIGGAGSLVGLFTGGSGGGAAPTFGDAVLLVLEGGSGGSGGTILTEENTSLDSTKVVKVGDTVLLRFKLFENQGIFNLEQFRMFLNFEGKNYDASIIDTHITYKRDGEITIVDPHEKIESVEIEILQDDPWNLILNVKIIFKNTFNTSTK